MLNNPTKISGAAFIVFAAGTTVELVLLKHYEDGWQIIPIVLMTLSAGIFIAIKIRPVGRLIGLFRFLMAACALSGLWGILLHFNVNREFAAELRPSEPPTTIWMKSLSGALPVMAPGSMVVFALIGYLNIVLLTNTNKP